MAKLAVIFVLFALFAIAMSARIAREEPKESNPALDTLNKIVEDIQKVFKEHTTPEKIEEMKNKFNELRTTFVDSLKSGSDAVNKEIQKA
ncbi:neuropeptide-like 2 [Drosophila bipectinata]|uniref:neuropeptide-like 2 n=1 Tax=Drosophila bipectinata TaxID=42026 RepID=UPI0007E868EF|nr:neuropeptide-like 2 [Drosophila bipectinata]